LTEFLDEARKGCGLSQIVLQSAAIVEPIDDWLRYSRTRIALRYRPPLGLLPQALIEQLLRASKDVLGCGNWRLRKLLFPTLVDLPEHRFWISADLNTNYLLRRSKNRPDLLAITLSPHRE
jgi:hypothetical protein